MLAACDVAFLSFMDSPLFEKTIPAKLQSYMACGMPILASASGETKRIIEEAQCGICCELGNAEQLFESILSMKQKNICIMGKQSKDYIKTHFNKELLMSQMDSFLVIDVEDIIVSTKNKGKT